MLNKVSVLFTWGIDYVDRILLFVTGCGTFCQPVTECCGTLDCDTLFTFEVHAVHFSPHVVATTDFMNVLDSAGVIEDSFCQRGLARVNVSGDSDIPLELEPCVVLFRELVNWGGRVCGYFRSDL